MAKLEQVTVGSTVKGIVGNEAVSIVAVQWYGTNVLEIHIRTLRELRELNFCIEKLSLL